MKRMNEKFHVPKPSLPLVAWLLTMCMGAHAATIVAASCAQTAVQTAVNAASDGDTVQVPAGSCTWTSAVSISDKTVSLRGAGSSSTGTRIQHGGANHTLVYVNPGSKTGAMAVSGFLFTGASNENWGGTAMQIAGPVGWKKLRVHDNVFENNYPWTMQVQTQTHALIDRNTIRGRAFGIKTYGRGAVDWSTPLTLGTADFLFVENNNFDMDDWYGNTGIPIVDMFDGGRVVFRNNTGRHYYFGTHDRARSGQVSANAFEVYNNTVSTVSNKWKGMDISAGTGVIWNNKFTGDYTHAIGAIDYKTFDPRSIPRCDGTDPVDQNVPGQSGWRCQYQIGTQGEGASAYSVPLYLWSNSINGAAADMRCTDGCTHVQAGRDFINNGSAAKPGYVPYVYPHPLSSGNPTPPVVLSAPTNLRVR